MPSLVFWDHKKYTLEKAVADSKLKEMRNSVNGSNYSYTLDCIDAAQAVGELVSSFLGVALKLGDQYIDLTEEEGSDLFHERMFDCPSELFDRVESQEVIKIYKKAEE